MLQIHKDLLLFDDGIKEEIDKEILQLEKIILENGQFSKTTFSPEDLLLTRIYNL